MSPTTSLRPARTLRTSVEALESRIAPAAFVVNTLNDVVAADGFVSLREAIQAANTNLAVNEAPAGFTDGDSISFDPSLFGSIELSSPLTISDDLIIDGSLPAHDIIGIDGLHATQLFLIDTSSGVGASKDVSLSHLTLENGITAAATSSGGAILLTASKLIVDDVEFGDNAAIDGGGAIYADHATLTVGDSAFHGNTASSGGAIGANQSTVLIKDSFFSDNHTSGNGGAIAGENEGSLTLTKVDFDANTGATGGAISVFATPLIYTTGTVSNNTAASGLGSGGGISAGETDVTLNFVDFLDNVANDEGGAVSYSAVGAPVLTIHGGYYGGNHGGQFGGAIASSGAAVIDFVEFDSNSATGSGGAVAVAFGSLSLSNSSLHDNSTSAVDAPDVFHGGGGVFVSGFLSMVQCTLSDNTTDAAGGNLYLANGTTNLDNSTIVGGTAGLGGPNIAVRDAALHVTSTIVAGATSDIAFVAAATGSISLDHSLVQTITAAVTSTASLTGVDPLLGSFGDHGGFLPTYDLQPGSPAIDVGLDPHSLPTDQRGAPFARTQGPGIDIGAVESLPDPVVTLLSGGKKAQFTDMDGDLVTVSTNKGAFTQSDFFLVADGIGARLIGLDISNRPEFAGANISVKAKPTNRGGDGFVNVSFFDASGVDLGNVLIDGDITDFHAGDDDASTAGVNGLSVASAGEYQGFGEIHVNGSLNSLKVRTDMTDTDITISGGPLANLGKTKVTGSVYGADIEIDGGVSTFTVAGNLIGTDFIAEGSIGTISASTTPGKFRYSGGLVVKGSILGGDIGTNGDLANLRVSGDLQSTRVTVRGDLNPADVLAAQTIGQLTVGGRVYQSDVLVGYDLDVLAVNPDVLVEKVAVTGNLVASNLSVGADAGADGFFGTVDDTPIGIGNAAIVSRIASLTIKGAAYGTPGQSGDYFGIAAEEIVKGKIALAPLALSTGASNDLGPALFGTSFDFAIHEVGATV